MPLDPETVEKLRALGYVDGGVPTEPSLADPKDMMPVLQGIHKAGALLAQGRPHEALAEVEKAERLSPRDRTVLQIRGAIYLTLGQPEPAEEAFRRSLEIKPSADVCAMLAQIMLKDGRHTEAREMLDQAMALDPNYSRPIVNLATSAMRARDWEKAEQWLEQAVKVGAKNPVAWANLGRVRHELEKGTESEAAWLRATELSPRVPLFWQQLGRVRWEMLEDAAGARSALERARDLDPQDEKTRALLESLP